MKKRILFSSGLLIFFSFFLIQNIFPVSALSSGTPTQYWDEEWTTFLGSGDSDVTNKISPDPSTGSVYALGTYNNGTANCYYLAKLNGSGILLWSKEYGYSQREFYDLLFDPLTNHTFILGRNTQDNLNTIVTLWAYDQEGSEVGAIELVNKSAYNGGKFCFGSNNTLYVTVFNSSSLWGFKIELTTLSIVKSKNFGVIPGMSLQCMVYVPITDFLYLFVNYASGYSGTYVHKIDCQAFTDSYFVLPNLGDAKEIQILSAAVLQDRLYLTGRNHTDPYSSFLAVTDLNVGNIFTTIFLEHVATSVFQINLIDNGSSVLLLGTSYFTAYDEDKYQYVGLGILYRRYSDPDVFRLESTVAFSYKTGQIDFRSTYVTSDGTLYAGGLINGIISGTKSGFVMKYPNFVNRMQGKMTTFENPKTETDESLLDRIMNQDWQVVGIIALIAFIMGACIFHKSSKSKSR